MFLKSKGGKNRSLRLFFRKIHTFNLPTIRSIQGSAGWTANCPRGPPVLSNLPGKSGVCGRRKGIHSLSQWTLSFKSLKLYPTRRVHGNLWMGKVWNFIFPTKYVIICNPRKFKVWAIGQNVRKKIYVPLKAWSRTRKNAPSLRFQKIDSWFKRNKSCNKNCLILDANQTPPKVVHWYFSKYQESFSVQALGLWLEHVQSMEYVNR